MEDWEVALQDLRHELTEQIEDLKREVDELRDQLDD